jgi:uncharacterized protein YbjQ (UPF0145 family)
MISRCKEVEVDDAVAGMVLFRDVLDQRGAVLLQKDTELTDSLLTSLRRRGIDSVPVFDAAVDEAVLAAERVRVGQRLARLLRHCGNGRAEAMLRASLRAYRMGTLQ